MSYQRRAVLAIFVCVASLVSAQVAGTTWPGKWYVQTGVFFPNQQFFQEAYTFDRTVYTQKLQIAYSCTDCAAASIDVTLPDGTQLMPSIWFDGTIPSNTQEWTIYPTKIDSIVLTISTEQPKGLIRVGVMGTDTRSSSNNQQ